MKKLLMIIFIGILTNIFAAETIHLYGGSNQDKYLGCVNCAKYDADSICNKYGTYGSKYNDESIWNKYGTYGSKYNSESPWNKYSTDAPVLVDKSGGFYGYFTLNQYIGKRTNAKLLVYFFDKFEEFDDLEDAREWLCEQL